jgi:hypothetical protein
MNVTQLRLEYVKVRRTHQLVQFVLHPAFQYRIGLAKALRDRAYRTIAAQNY